MEIVGDVDKFKERLDKIYQKRLDNQLADIKERDAKITAIVSQRKQDIKSSFKLRTEEDAALLKRKVINSEKFKAKQEFEKTREEIISEVFDAAIKKAPEFVKTKSYINYVKANLPKSTTVVLRLNKELAKEFNGKTSIDNDIIGVQAVDGKVIYDFTVAGLIEAKYESLRVEVDNVLFGN
ncbi:V-type ATP synthase subunit E [Candidatus Woesearchaeota archaeon]|nr:V-type ATP synthase subunit E [Candidatus Woesearchaeota archaeon]